MGEEIYKWARWVQKSRPTSSTHFPHLLLYSWIFESERKVHSSSSRQQKSQQKKTHKNSLFYSPERDTIQQTQQMLEMRNIAHFTNWTNTIFLSSSFLFSFVVVVIFIKMKLHTIYVKRTKNNNNKHKNEKKRRMKLVIWLKSSSPIFMHSLIPFEEVNKSQMEEGSSHFYLKFLFILLHQHIFCHFTSWEDEVEMKKNKLSVQFEMNMKKM